VGSNGYFTEVGGVLKGPVALLCLMVRLQRPERF
jgi:hypothetical protein